MLQSSQAWLGPQTGWQLTTRHLNGNSATSSDPATQSEAGLVTARQLGNRSFLLAQTVGDLLLCIPLDSSIFSLVR